jgi:hypothetical protein
MAHYEPNDSNHKNVPRALVLHGGALGDCALALHFIRGIRLILGPAQVALAARSSLVRWALRHGLVDDAPSLDRLMLPAISPPAPSVIPDPRSPKAGRNESQPYDCVISFVGDPGGPSTRKALGGSQTQFISIDPKPDTDVSERPRHIVQQWLERFLDAARIRVRAADSVLDMMERLEREGPELAPASDGGAVRGHVLARRTILCHPRSGGLSKCCPLPDLEAVASALKEEDWSPAWMIGPDEVERFGDSLAQRLSHSAPVIFEESVEKAADMVCAAAGFIGNDAGMTHVAGLCGVPTVAIFGPTDPVVWRPLGRRCKVAPFPAADKPTGPWVQTIVSWFGTHAQTSLP